MASKATIAAIIIALFCWIWTLHQEVSSLQTIVEAVRDREVPRVTVTGKYPYINVEKGEVIIYDGRKDLNPKRQIDEGSGE